MLIPGRRIPVLLLLLVLTIRAGQAHAAPAVCTLFSAASSYATAAGPQSVAVGDFNSDGIPDLAVAATTATKVSVLLGQGSGGTGNGTYAAPVDFGTGGTSRFVSLGDFNEDGI